MSNYIYMAGLMDGEGTIGISYHSNKKFRSPYISITSTTPEIILWLKDTFGGSVSVQKVYKEHHKPSWSWRLQNLSDIAVLLTNILPHMKEPDKIRRGNLLLSQYPAVTVRNGKYTAEQLSAKLSFEKEFLGY